MPLNSTTITPTGTDGAYAEVNGLKLYYEVRGVGAGGDGGPVAAPPLVALHSGGHTAGLSFGPG